jgi:hypothetical protein
MAESREHIRNICSREKRWLVVLQDGQHSTIGRHTDPTQEELDVFATQIDRLGVAGWLVISEGVYHSRDPVTLMCVRRLSGTDGDWTTAETLWRERRANSVG